MENGKVFKIIVPFLDTAIPNKHDFIFIKEVDTTMGSCFSGGGGAMSSCVFLPFLPENYESYLIYVK